MRGKNPASEPMPPLFGLPPAIQKMSVKQASACAAESALVAFEVVDEQHAPLAPDLLHPVGEAGKREQTLLDRLRGEPERQRRAGGAGGVLGVVKSAQRADAADLRDHARIAARGVHDPVGLHVDAVRQRPARRHAQQPLAGALDAVGSRGRPVVVDPDDRGAALLHSGDQALLHRRIVAQRSMTIQVVLGDVDENADRRIERRREVDLVGGDLDHVHTTRPRRLEREDGGADIAADLGIVTGGAREMGGERSGGRLAVGAGDRHERGGGRLAATLAAEQLDVADHLDRRSLRAPDRPVRRRMGERHAGREHQRGDSRPVDPTQVGGRYARTRGLGEGIGIVVPAHDVGAAAQQRARSGQTRAAQTEDRHPSAGEAGDRDHLNFSVDKPASASTTEMIQNRITICGSVHPFCSK